MSVASRNAKYRAKVNLERNGTMTQLYTVYQLIDDEWIVKYVGPYLEAEKVARLLNKEIIVVKKMTQANTKIWLKLHRMEESLTEISAIQARDTAELCKVLANHFRSLGAINDAATLELMSNRWSIIAITKTMVPLGPKAE